MTGDLLRAAQFVGGPPRLGSEVKVAARARPGAEVAPWQTLSAEFEGPSLDLGRPRTIGGGRRRPGWQRRMHTLQGRSRTTQTGCRSGRLKAAPRTDPSRQPPSACWRCEDASWRRRRPRATEEGGMRARQLPKRVDLGLHGMTKRQKKSQKSTTMCNIDKGPNWTQLRREASLLRAPRGGATLLVAEGEARRRG